MVLNKHPRPDFRRESWMSLDGAWDFSFQNSPAESPDRVVFSHTIQVPYVCGTPLSGVENPHPEKTNCVWYRKSFEIDPLESGRQVRLHFGAVDYEAEVWINGCFIGGHQGGYTPFDFDVTPWLQTGKNTVAVQVRDDFFAQDQPRGKQSWTVQSPFACHYTPFIGLWQSVWLEWSGKSYIKGLRLETDTARRWVTLEVETSTAAGMILQADVAFQGLPVCTCTRTIGDGYERLGMEISDEAFPWDGVALWSPENPQLYDLTLRLLDGDTEVDRVDSYFGMRDLELRGDKLLINNYPIYQKLLLNQGYYPGGGVTPDTPDRFAQDVALIKRMGFNGIRIHGKIENPLLLYECDRQGLLVWEELPPAYAFTSRGISALLDEWGAAIKRDWNHPCIITWVCFNESWGVPSLRGDRRQQAFVMSMYHLARALDGSRPVIGNDGWEHTLTDICTIHDYVADGGQLYERYRDKEALMTGMPSPLYPRYVFADGYAYAGQPVIISEYGGIALEGGDGWGYDGKAADAQGLLSRMANLTDAIKSLPYVSGYCYTQFTDIEAEQNGLVDMERNPKVDLDQVARINSKPIVWG